MIAGAGLTADEVPVIEAFANHISVALENARLNTDMQQTYQQLKTSEEKFRTLFESQTDTVVLLDKDFRHLAINHPLIGKTPQELIGKTIYETLPPDLLKQRIPLLKQVLKTGEPVRVETNFTGPEKKQIWVDTIISPHRSNNGEIIGIISQSRNITAQKEAERKLVASENKYFTALNKAPDAVITVSLQGNILDFNKTAEKLYGYKKQEVVGKKIFILDTDVGSGKNLFQTVKKQGSAQVETVQKRKNGSTFPAWISANLHQWNGEQVLQGFIRDATQWKERETAIRESEAKLQSIMNVSADGITIVNAQGTIQYLNPANERMLGYQPGELLGKKIWLMVPPEKRKAIRVYFQQVIQEQLEENTLEVENLRKDGSRFLVELRWSYLRDGDKVSGIVTNVRDISERKRNENELRLLQEINNAINIGTPLTDVLQIAADGLRMVFDYAACDIYLLHKENKELVYTALSIESNILKKVEKLTTLMAYGLRIPLSEGSSFTDVVENKRVYTTEDLVKVFEDFTDNKKIKALAGQAARLTGFKSVIRVPLIAKGEVIGIIGAASNKNITRQDAADVLERFASQLALVIKKFQVEQEIKQKTEDLNLINSINEMINKGASLQEIFNLLNKETQRIFSGYGASVYLLSSDKKELVLHKLSLPEIMVKQIEKLIGKKLPPVRIPLTGDSLYQKALIAGRPQILNEAETIQQLMTEFIVNIANPGTRAYKAIHKLIPQINKILDMKSVINVPLMSENEAVGLLDMARSESFTESDVERLKLISEQLTAAIERWQAEEKVREAEIRYRTMFEQSPDGVLIIDPETEMPIEFNDVAHRQLGYTREEFAKLKITDFAVNDSGEEIKSCVEKAMREGRADFETEHHTMDGKIRNVLVSVQEIQLGGKNVLHCIVRDMTERVQAEKELVESYQELQLIEEINRASLGGEPFDQIVGRVFTAFSKLCKTEMHSVYIYNNEQQKLVRYYSGISKEQMRKIKKLTGVNPLDFVPIIRDGYRFAEALKSGKSFIASTPQEIAALYAEFIDSKTLKKFITPVIRLLKVKYIAVIPLHSGESPLGLIIFYMQEKLSQKDMERLERFSNQAASTLVKVQTEEQIRKLSHVVQQSPSSVVITDINGSIEYVNPKFTQLTGYTYEEVKGENSHILKSGEMSSQEYKNLWDTIISGREWRGEFHNKKKNGELYWEAVSISPITNQQGSITHYLAIKEDITERKLIEVEREAAHTLLQSTIDGIDDPIMVIGLDYQVKLMNRVVRKKYFNNNSVKLQCYYQISHYRNTPCNREKHPCPLERVSQTMQPVTMIHEHIQKDGEKRHVEINASPIFNEDGTLNGIIESSRDITKRVLAEEESLLLQTIIKAISESQSFQDALEITLCQVCQATGWSFGEAWIPNAERTVLECSPVFCDISNQLDEFRNLSTRFTFPKNTGLPGRVWFSKQPEWIADVSAEPESLFRRTKMAKQVGLKAALGIPIIEGDQVLAVLTFFMFHRRKEDQRLTKLVSAMAAQLGTAIQRRLAQDALRESEDRYRRLVEFSPDSIVLHRQGEIIFINETGVKLAGANSFEEQLRQSQKMEAIGTLAGSIAHDFNNILTPIIGYTDMAIDDVPQDSQLQSDLKRVLNTAKRAKNLVQQILTFSRQAEPEHKPVNLYPIVNEALKMLRSSLPATIEIKKNIDKDCGVVKADVTQIHQVLMNLCTNAYHAMGEKGGVLEVNLTNVEANAALTKLGSKLHEGNYVRLTVRDSGCGMDSTLLKRIFEPFFTTKEVGKGTGLGLSVAHGIIVNHGGEITVDSENGKGTTFHVYLPRVDSNVEKQNKEDEPILKGSERILFVDDEKEIAQMMKRMLQRLGYHITVRTSSKEALEIFRKQPHKYDLIITDQTMPRMTGLELAEKLLQYQPDLPIILMTGFSEIVTPENLQKIGIREFIMKPVVARDLGKMIRQVLDKKK